MAESKKNMEQEKIHHHRQQKGRKTTKAELKMCMCACALKNICAKKTERMKLKIMAMHLHCERMSEGGR